MVKTYIINLQESTERRSFMDAQLKLFPELDFQFLKATDARKLSETELLEYYDEKKALATLNRPMVRGEIGVAISQVEALKSIEENHNFGLIMEDDLLISPYFSESLNSAIDFINSPYPRIVLFTPIPQYSALNPISINILQSRKIYKVWKDASCAACYLINKSACQIIINEYPKVSNVIDNWGYFIKNDKIDIRAVVPHVVAFSKYGLDLSTINIADTRDSKITGTRTNFSIFTRIKLKTLNYYYSYRYKVSNSKNIWYNNISIIQSDF